jgi:exonuclease SbcC
MAELAAIIRRADWATEIQADLKEVESELAAVGYDEVAHQQVRNLVSELGVFEDERTRLFTAEENLRNERGHLTQFQQTEAQSERDLASTKERVATLTGELRRWDACQSELRGLEGELATLQAEEAKLRQSLGAARQKLDTCTALEKLREQKMSERTAVLNQKAIYEELRLAFSKRGLQAMIIENIIPEIEDEANAILFRMTDGRMRLKLDTQRENKDKEVVETLDITVSDESGPRSYDLYSGGEAFRINFALRVALSKLLARRAGASLQTLVIDEGFGTQDAQGRERLIEAINSIQDDFEKVLVITHIEELREAFPVHIEVFKTASGSQIRVS